MPIVVLRGNNRNYSFGPSKYTITEQLYEYGCFFTRYEHTPQGKLKAEAVTVYKDYENGSGRRAVFANLGSYVTAVLDKAHVYYNKSDRRLDRPLILVLFFKDSPTAKNRYYVRSKFEGEISGNRNKYLGELDEYTGEQNLLSHLLKENGNLHDSPIYEVDIITEGTYNDGKITVSKEDEYPTFGFTKYTHKPVLKTKSKGCVLYNKKILLGKTTGHRMVISDIKEVQNIVINTISVYYSDKNKEPLMIYLHKEDNGKQEHVYYFPKIHGILYWQILDSTTFSTLLRQRVDKTQIHAKLTQHRGKLLIEAFQKIRNGLNKLLIILLDGKNDYLEKDVIDPLKTAEFNTDEYLFANNYGKISIRDVSSSCQFPSDSCYKVYEHDLTDVSKSVLSYESVKIRFTLSRPDRNRDDVDLLTINLDYQYESGGYNSQSLYISVSNATNPIHKFKWYNHNCEKNIFDRSFKLGFNGQYATVVGDLSDEYLNCKVLFVYFEYDYRDAFILVAFTDPDFTKIMYLTYDKFMENILRGTPIQISRLDTMSANIKVTYLLEESGYKIDTLLLAELKRQYSKLQSDTESSIDSLVYQKTKDKLYVYTSPDGSKILMICYNDKAYTRYFLNAKTSRWMPITGVTSCLCEKDPESQESSYKILESLKRISTLHGLIRPEKTTKHVQLEMATTIDISILGPSSYHSNSITVTKQAYENCNLFVNYTHAPNSGKPFKITSLKDTNFKNRTITLKNEVIDVKSVDVYFNEFVLDKPLILCIITNNGTCKYYKDLMEEESYKIIEYPQISSDNLFDKLIEENDKINNSFTYHIDKTAFNTLNTIKYGNGGTITVTKLEDTENYFISHDHKPTNTKPKRSYVLHNRNLLVVRSQDDGSIQGKPYSSIKVYSLIKEKNSLLLIGFHESSSTYYSLKKDGRGLYWGKEKFSFKGDLSIKNKLREINYLLKSSVIIEIDRRDITSSKSTSYEMKIIENKINDRNQYECIYLDGKVQPRKNITVSQPHKIHDGKANTPFKHISHDISDAGGLSVSVNTNSNITGIRLFMRNSTEETPTELELYPSAADANQPKKRLFLYYPPLNNINKLYVYFHDNDPRTLALCYDGQMYKRVDISNNIKWFCTKAAKCSEPTQVFGTLKSIYQSMEVKVTFVIDKKQTNIQPKNERVGDFRKDSYKAESKKEGPFKLSKDQLTEGITDTTIIDSLMDKLNNLTFDAINVYYEVKTKPLFFEFIDRSIKTHFQRRDPISKYWVKEEVEYGKDNLGKKLETIKTTVDETIVYEINKKINNYNVYITLRQENSKPTTGFTKYTHTPKQQYSSKKALPLYNLNKLTKMDKSKFSPLTEIEGHQYQSVDVYFGTKTKDSADLPLIVVFTKTGSDPKSYYRHKFYKSSDYWENVTIQSGDTENKQLINMLRETEIDLVESVVILIDRKGAYGNTQMDKAVRGLSPVTKIKLAPIGEDIKVRDITDTGAKCVSQYGYKLYEHNLGSYFAGDKYCSLRIFVLTKDSTDNYTELKLYNSSDILETLYYEKSGGSNKNKLYVCFYGEKDPRPLLVCYGYRVFGPKGSDSYFEKWYKFSNISSCQCQSDYDNPQFITTLSEVVKVLNVVQLEKRPKIIEPQDENPNSDGKNHFKYPVQTYNGKEIDITVGYQNKKCYRVYIHKPYGGSGTGEAYRLGSIKYGSNGSDTNILEYESSHPLLSVSVYYSVYDENHKNPLLVSLEFKNNDGNSHEYYKLKEKNGTKWEKIENGQYSDVLKQLNENDTFEDGLYNLRNKLDIKFENKNNIKPLFKIEKCEEDKTDIAAIAGGTAGAAAVVGTGITIGVIVSKKLAAAAVTTVAAAAAAAA